MSDNYNKNRILKNSCLLYVRMLFTMWLNLWTTRLVLANLGIEDMGVYGVVGSIVNMFMILTSGVGTAIQRFITFEMGKKEGNPNSIFCSSLNVIFILSILVLILLEIVGLWFLNNKVNIPQASMTAAQWVFQLSVLTCIINVISIPYNALIIAHEKMNAFAFISILQVILTCTSAYCLSYLDNRLLFYAIFMALISILIRIIYQIYCVIKFPEAQYHFIINTSQIRQLLKFAGVSTTSGILQIISSQGVTFVINWTFGVAINAIYTIALQLKNSILSFAQNIQKAIAPQITKTYASGEIELHKKLIYSGSKMQVFMIYFIMIPFLFRTEYIMQLWLGAPPKYTIEFVQCIIFLSLTYAAFEPIRTAVLATNKITKFMLIPDIANLLALPLSYIIGKVTKEPGYLIFFIVIFEILTCILRIYYATQVSIIKAKDLISNVISRSILVALLSSIICYFLAKYTESDLQGLIILLIINSFILCGLIFIFGLTKYEKRQIIKLIHSMWK